LLLALTLLAQSLLPHVHLWRDDGHAATTSAAAAFHGAVPDEQPHADAACPLCQLLSQRSVLAPRAATASPRPLAVSWTPTSTPPPAHASVLARHAPRSPPRTL